LWYGYGEMQDSIFKYWKYRGGWVLHTPLLEVPAIPRVQKGHQSDTWDLRHPWWGDTSGVCIRYGILDIEDASYPWRLGLKWWLKGNSPQHDSRMLRVTSVGGVSWELWHTKEGFALRQRQIWRPYGSPNSWERHMEIVKIRVSPFGHTN
jgi:hypothetical protein